MNKYGGVADLKGCNKRVYNLWYQMLRRCYDKEQHKRGRGKAYADCEVCEEYEEALEKEMELLVVEYEK
jgi:hypothetical protein